MDDFESYDQWKRRRERLVALAEDEMQANGASRRYFDLIGRANDGLGRACVMLFRELLAK